MNATGEGPRRGTFNRAIKRLGYTCRGCHRQTSRDPRVFDLRTRRNFNDFKGIVFVFSVLLALHDQHIFEALVIRGTVKSRAVAKTIKFKAFKCCNNTTRIECTGTLAGICIEQGLGVNGLSGIGWREAVFGAEGFNERFGALVLQGP